MQGLELRLLSERYLVGIDGEESTDLCIACQRLQRTLDELAAAVRRAGLQGAAATPVRCKPR